MKSFFSLILTGCTEVFEVSVQPAKGDFALLEIYNFFRNTRRLNSRRVRFFRFHLSKFSIFSKPVTIKINFNTIQQFSI